MNEMKNEKDEYYDLISSLPILENSQEEEIPDSLLNVLKGGSVNSSMGGDIFIWCLFFLISMIDYGRVYVLGSGFERDYVMFILYSMVKSMIFMGIYLACKGRFF